VACPEGFLLVCRGTFRVESPVGCQVGCRVVWEEGYLEDPAGLDPSKFLQTRVQGPVLCQGFLISLIHLIKAIHHFNRLDHRAHPLLLEWDTQVQRQLSPCWLSKIGTWKPSNGGPFKRENKEREVA